MSTIWPLLDEPTNEVKEVFEQLVQGQVELTVQDYALLALAKIHGVKEYGPFSPRTTEFFLSSSPPNSPIGPLTITEEYDPESPAFDETTIFGEGWENTTNSGTITSTITNTEWDQGKMTRRKRVRFSNATAQE